MKHFYRNVDHQISYAQGIEDVRQVVARLSTCQPLDLLSWTTNCFGEPVDESSTLTALQRYPPAPTFEKIMKDSLGAIVQLLNRQYKKQFECSSEELREVTKSSRSNNIHAEQIMGMLSASIHRAPAATVAFHSAKIRAQKNDTLHFLSNWNEREAIISSARLYCSQTTMKRNTRQQKELLEELVKRQVAKEVKKDQAARSRMERQLKKGNIIKQFPELSSAALQVVENLMDGKSVGLIICHVWEEDQSRVIYTGRLLKYYRARQTYKVAYWSQEEAFDDATDYDIKASALAADFICGDLTL